MRTKKTKKTHNDFTHPCSGTAPILCCKKVMSKICLPKTVMLQMAALFKLAGVERS